MSYCLLSFYQVYIFKGNHPLVPKKKITKTKTNQFDENSEKEEECIKIG